MYDTNFYLMRVKFKIFLALITRLLHKDQANCSQNNKNNFQIKSSPA